MGQGRPPHGGGRRDLWRVGLVDPPENGEGGNVRSLRTPRAGQFPTEAAESEAKRVATPLFTRKEGFALPRLETGGVRHSFRLLLPPSLPGANLRSPEAKPRGDEGESRLAAAVGVSA